ncbi:flagellar hook-length control protein FliK [Pseudomonadota bacterium]|nr:flagellar hook-length control protein FliK [Pseudomonadota bacterium]
MGQQLLQVGVSSPTVSGDNKVLSDHAANPKDKDVKAFSSTLNEQLERPLEAQDNNKKSTELANDKHVNSKSDTKREVEGKEKVKAEVQDIKSGNNLSSDSELVDIDESEVGSDGSAITTDKSIDVDEEFDKEGTEIASVDLAATPQTITVITSETKPQAATVAKGKESNPQLSENSNREQIVAASKTTQNNAMNVDELSDEAAEAKPILRSDILHAIIKKQDAGVSKNKPTTIVAKEIPVIAEKQPDIQVSERQKMAQILNATRNDGLVLRPSQERVPSTFSPSAMLTSTASTSSTLAPQAPSVGQSVLSMQPPVQSEAWGKVLSSRVVWMAREGVQQAQLRLNPANLGPVEVKLHMHNDQVNVSFVAQHAATRDALEQALPRLRENLQENGMNLSDADVSEQASEQESEEGSGETSSNKQGQTHHSDDVELESAALDANELEVGVSLFA